MNQVVKLATLILALGLSAGIVRAQSADEIVDRHLAALGGREALGKIQTRVSTGSISISTASGAFSGSLTRYDKLPNKSRVVTRIDLSSMGAGELTRDQRFDGSTAILTDSRSGENELTGNALESLRNAAFPSLYLHYKDRGSEIELAGKEKVNDRDAYVLIFKPKSGPSSKHYIDAETYLIVKSVGKIGTPQGGELDQTSEISDYRATDGIKVAYQVKQTNSLQSVTVTFSKIEQNVPVDDAMFVKPVAEKK